MTARENNVYRIESADESDIRTLNIQVQLLIYTLIRIIIIYI